MEPILAHLDPLAIGVAIGLGIGELIRRLKERKETKEAKAEIG